MTMKEIASAFDMSVCDMAEEIGYSRQTLYCGNFGQTERAENAAKWLESINESKYKAQILMAEMKREEREKAIRAFRGMIERGADNGNETHD